MSDITMQIVSVSISIVSIISICLLFLHIVIKTYRNDRKAKTPKNKNSDRGRNE